MTSKENPTVRDEIFEKLNRDREERKMEEQRRQMPQYRPGGFVRL